MSPSQAVPWRLPTGEEADTGTMIRQVLDAVRRHLDMDVAFLGELTDDQEIFRAVVGDAGSFGLTEGSAVPLPETYCHAMVQGRIDRVVADTAAEPVVANLAATTRARIGRYVGVPVHLPDGRLYGALCGIGHEADPGLRARDARFLEFLASLVEVELGREDAVSARRRALEAGVRPLLDGTGLRVVFQPIVDLSAGTTVGYEALARFSAEPRQPPDAWFAAAAEVGLGVELEMTAIARALSVLELLPANAFLTVNASAETACSAPFQEALAAMDGARVVVEITEHAAVANYQVLTAALAALRARGARLAVDDAGAGVASLHHILELAPEFIKLDISLTRGIHASPSRAALATALVSFGAATGAAILAEGIETPAELEALRRLGVTYGQGFLLGRPGGPPRGRAGSGHRVCRHRDTRRNQACAGVTGAPQRR